MQNGFVILWQFNRPTSEGTPSNSVMNDLENSKYIDDGNVTPRFLITRKSRMNLRSYGYVEV